MTEALLKLGQPEKGTNMTNEERAQKINSYGKAYETLVEALKQFPKEMWQFKPSDGWSIHEIVGLDLQADGGTHVANTSEVGRIRVVDYKSKGKINKRIEIEVGN